MTAALILHARLPLKRIRYGEKGPTSRERPSGTFLRDWPAFHAFRLDKSAHRSRARAAAVDVGEKAEVTSVSPEKADTVETRTSADTDTDQQPVLRDREGYVLTFFVPANKVGFILGRKGERKQTLEKRHDVRVYLKDSAKHFRKMTITAAKQGGISAFWKDLMLMAEQGNKVILDTTADGSRYRLRMLVPDWTSGLLLGEKGSTMKGIQAETGCLLGFKDPVEGSSARLLALAGNHQSLLLALKKVVSLLEEEPYFKMVIPKQTFVLVPKERLPEVKALVNDLEQRFTGIVAVSWVNPTQKLKSKGAKRLRLYGPSVASALIRDEVKQVLERPSFWGENSEGT